MKYQTPFLIDWGFLFSNIFIDMKKTIRLTESELISLIKKVINENNFFISEQVPVVGPHMESGEYTIDDYRESMYSMPTTFLMSLASYFPYTKAIPIIAYGVLLVDDVKKCFETECDWVNILIDGLSVIVAPQVATILKTSIQTSIKLAKPLLNNVPKLINFLCTKVKNLSQYIPKIASTLKELSTRIDEVITLMLNTKLSNNLKKFGQWLKSSSNTVKLKLVEWSNYLIEGYNNFIKKIEKPVQKLIAKPTTKRMAIATTKSLKDAGVNQLSQNVGGKVFGGANDLDLKNVSYDNADLKASKKINWD